MTTENTEKLDEKFEASFEVPAELPDPIDTKDNHRPADKSEGEKASPKLTKAQMVSGIAHASYKLSHPELTDKYRQFFAMKGDNVSAEYNKSTIKAGGLKEDMDAVFEGSDLSEEFKDKATTIFEAAVNGAIVQETVRLEEEFETRLQEEVKTIMSTLSESISMYIEEAADKWLEENKLQVEAGLRADIMESFLHGLKGLFVEHYVEVPEDAVDVVESLTAKVEELSDKLNESENARLEAKKELEESVAAGIRAEAAKDLTESQKEKLATLTEGLDFTDEETYRTKLTQIIEGLVTKAPVVPADVQLNEEVNLDADKKTPTVDPIVAAALGHAKSTWAKK